MATFYHQLANKSSSKPGRPNVGRRNCFRWKEVEPEKNPRKRMRKIEAIHFKLNWTSFWVVLLRDFKESESKLLFHLCNLMYAGYFLWRKAFLSTCHFVNLSFCQLVILSTCHFDNLSFCQLVILSTCHFVNLSFWQNDKLTNRQVDKMTSWQNDKLTKYKLTKWQVDKMTSWQNDKLTKWQGDEIT